mgnify:CR=1 FL=1
MNKNNTIPTLAITRLAPRLAAHPASWLALGLTVAALSLSPKATAGDHETEWAEARAELEERRAEVVERQAKIAEPPCVGIGRVIKSAALYLIHICTCRRSHLLSF